MLPLNQRSLIGQLHTHEEPLMAMVSGGDIQCTHTFTSPNALFKPLGGRVTVRAELQPSTWHAVILHQLRLTSLQGGTEHHYYGPCKYQQALPSDQRLNMHLKSAKHGFRARSIIEY